MILGTQWYILFNVATAYPTDFLEAADNFQIHGWKWWRNVILPGIFPYYVTGAITASGSSSARVAERSEAVDAGAPGAEIEVTPEMIEAALDYVFDVYGDWPATSSVAREMLGGVYSVMVSVARSGKHIRGVD